MPIRLGLGLQVGSNRPLSSLTPGTATVTLDASEEWTPASVPGANPLLPLIFRLYGNGGDGGLPEEGVGGGGGGGGAFVTGSRAVWTTGDSFAVTIGSPSVPGTSVVGNTPGVSDVSLLAGGGENASGIIAGLGSETYLTNGLTLTDTRAGGNGASVGGAVAGGGGASGSTGGAGNAGSGDTGGTPAAADGGEGGYGGDGDIGGAGQAPGGGAGGTSDPGSGVSSGANGRVVILVPTLT